MELPLQLRTAIEDSLSGEKPEVLKKLSRQMTERYKNESGHGKVLVSEDLEARVYAAVRMPATFGAVCDALSYTEELLPDPSQIRSVFDVGAGPGSASWAVEEIFSPDKIVCYEREASMRDVGAALMREEATLSAKTEWRAFDLEKDDFGVSSDLVMTSYVLNELSSGAREAVLRKLWDAADKLLVIVEPGTKEGFAVVREVRQKVLAWGGHLLAPCPHDAPCRLSSDDWCHFSCRVARSKLHKQLKDADVPYEDEKYSYIAFSKDPALAVSRAKARVLRHPVITKGQVELTLCTKDSNLSTVIRKRDGSAFKEARKCKMGDRFES